MVISLPDMQALAATCAPTVAAETLLSVAKVESGFNPLAIGVNGTPRITVRATSVVDAAAKAAALIAQGRSIDLGLAQINSRSLAWLGLTVEAAFDPCRNLAASARVLQDGYERAQPKAAGEQAALRTALSFYNTGHPQRGLRNGYVAKVANAAARIVPALQPALEGAVEEPVAAAPAPVQPSWDVFGQTAEPASFVIRVSAPDHKGGQE
ncbi:MAG: lytic transglycosylase domain-containing protein [Parcubacteria group bacterium]